MNGELILASTTLETQICRECGGIYALANGFIQQRRIKGGEWHCPYCNVPWIFTETDNARLKRLLKEQEYLNEAERQKTKDALLEAKHFRKSRDSMKGQVTRIKNRVEKGICPHCNRHFKNLQRHMESKHKEVIHDKEQT